MGIVVTDDAVTAVRAQLSKAFEITDAEALEAIEAALPHLVIDDRSEYELRADAMFAAARRLQGIDLHPGIGEHLVELAGQLEPYLRGEVSD
jgi:hypothetical protein